MIGVNNIPEVQMLIVMRLFIEYFTQSSLMELEDDSPPPSSPRLDRLSMRSDSPEAEGGQGSAEDKARLVITSLLAAALQHDAEVRRAASSSLSLVANTKPYMVLSEWHLMFGKERKKRMKETPNTRRRKSSAAVPTIPSNSQVHITPEPCTLLIEALVPCMKKVVKSDGLDGSDVRHRAILGKSQVIMVLTNISNQRSDYGDAGGGDDRQC